MSADITILSDECQEIVLEVKDKSIQIDVESKRGERWATITFNMDRTDHVNALKLLTHHLQTFLEAHDDEESQ